MHKHTNSFYAKLSLLLLIALASNFCAASQTARFSGAIAQSQYNSAGARICDLSPKGVANDPQTGEVLASFDGAIYKLAKDGSLEKVSVDGGRYGRLTSDGARLYCIDEYTMARLEKKDGKWRVEKSVYFNPAPMKIAVVNQSTKKGWAAKGKFFGLNRSDGKIYAFDADFKPLGAVFTPPPIKKGSGYMSVGILPESGDMMLSSEYPDLTIYRFDADAKPVHKNGWPFRCHYCALGGFAFVNGKIYALHSGASALQEHIVNSKDLEKFGNALDYPTFGVASDGSGGFYTATACGLKHYTAEDPLEASRRIGGAGRPKSVAVNDDGMVVVVSDGMLYGAMLDDFHDSPFISSGREPWRCGANWSSVPEIIAVRNGIFIVYDSKEKCVWSFNPYVDGTKRWEKLNMPDCENAENFVKSFKRKSAQVPEGLEEYDVCGKWIVGYSPKERAILRYKLK